MTVSSAIAQRALVERERSPRRGNADRTCRRRGWTPLSLSLLVEAWTVLQIEYHRSVSAARFRTRRGDDRRTNALAAKIFTIGRPLLTFWMSRTDLR